MRSSQRPAALILCAALAVLVGGYVASLFAQAPIPSTQDGLNMMLFERMRAISERQDNIEGMLKVGLTAVAMNLGAHLFQIWIMRRDKDNEPS